MVHSTTTTSKMIEPQLSTMLMQPLESASVVMAAGPTVFDSSEPLRIKKLVSGFTPKWVAEGEEIPDGGEAGFDEIQLMPTDRKCQMRVLGTGVPETRYCRVPGSWYRGRADGVGPAVCFIRPVLL
ncbi:hypothetical protein ACOJAW_10405, partial [Corynebacterium striatum]